MCGINTATTCEQNGNPQEKKFFNKNIKSRAQHKKEYKEKLEDKITNIVNGTKKRPRIIKHFVTKYSDDIKETLLWLYKKTHKKSAYKCEDRKEALAELNKDAERINRESEHYTSHSKTISSCYWSESHHNQTSACKNLAHAYDSFRFNSQGAPEIRAIQSLDNQISIHYDEKYTIALLEKAKKKLQDDLQNIDAPLFNSLKKSGSQYSLSNNPSYFESLSEENQKELITIIENVVCEKITNFDNLAKEFQTIFYVFHEKASCKYKKEKEALGELCKEIKWVYRKNDRFNHSTYAATAHSCELEPSYNKTSECKQLAQTYINFRHYSQGIQEIREIQTIDNEINNHSNDQHVITFLKKEKTDLEEKLTTIDSPLFNSLKKSETQYIIGNNPSYFESLSEKDQQALIAIIERVVHKKIDNPDKFLEEFKKTLNVFREKL